MAWQLIYDPAAEKELSKLDKGCLCCILIVPAFHPNPQPPQFLGALHLHFHLVNAGDALHNRPTQAATRFGIAQHAKKAFAQPR